MNKILNTEKITKIVMHPTACVKCKLGQDWAEHRFDITFVPREYYPDYAEVQDYIMRNIDGKELNIEQAIQNIYIFLTQYNPAQIVITDSVSRCKTHFDVEATLEGGKM